MTTFTADMAYDELIEDVGKDTLDPLVKELIVRAVGESREEMQDDLPAEMKRKVDTDELLGKTHKKMFWYLAGVNTSVCVGKLADSDSMYASVAREAKAWVNAWADRFNS